MNIALFGGTFDPIHSGHLQAAEAAARRFGLDQVWFIPAGRPPHKLRNHLTPFVHRYSMVALACAEHPKFGPSLLEAPAPDGGPHYSVDTVRRVRRALGRRDRLYFLIGVDAFLDLPHWKQHRSLLNLVNFIVVSRPGYSDRMIEEVIPRGLRAATARHSASGEIPLRRSTLHILRGVNSPAASRQVREALRAGRRVAGLVPPLVEEYMRKEGLYGLKHPATTRR